MVLRLHRDSQVKYLYFLIKIEKQRVPRVTQITDEKSETFQGDLKKIDPQV